jgi:hypothetical protein
MVRRKSQRIRGWFDEDGRIRLQEQARHYFQAIYDMGTFTFPTGFVELDNLEWHLFIRVSHNRRNRTSVLRKSQ